MYPLTGAAAGPGAAARRGQGSAPSVRQAAARCRARRRPPAVPAQGGTVSHATACRIDRVFPEIGRLNVVSGAHTRGDHEARNALITKLYRLGMLDHLRA